MFRINKERDIWKFGNSKVSKDELAYGGPKAVVTSVDSYKVKVITAALQCFIQDKL
jgi:hypothetical protein